MAFGGDHWFKFIISFFFKHGFQSFWISSLKRLFTPLALSVPTFLSPPAWEDISEAGKKLGSFGSSEHVFHVFPGFAMSFSCFFHGVSPHFSPVREEKTAIFPHLEGHPARKPFPTSPEPLDHQLLRKTQKKNKNKNNKKISKAMRSSQKLSKSILAQFHEN